jgi:DNA polymerase-3 subunit gamma/tau
LIGRDLLLDLIDAVVDEDGPRAFAMTDRAVESGHDLRLIVRELSRVVRDLMMLSVDPSRAGDGELAEGEVERLTALAKRFSREDLIRAFDLLTEAEQEIKVASHPRYYLEMALLRWMHLRKLVPLMELLEGGGSGAPARSAPAPTRGAIAPTKSAIAPTSHRIAPSSDTIAPTPKTEFVPPTDASALTNGLKDRLLAEVRSAKNTLYSLAIAQAQRIDVTDERITFTFASNQNVARGQLEQNREWLEGVAERLSGRRIPVSAVQSEAQAAPAAGTPPAASPPKRDLKAEARSSPGVQALLEVFPAEIRDVEEM